MLALIIVIGSVDTAEYYDQSLLTDVLDVDDSNNGFSEIAFTQLDVRVLNYESKSDVLATHVGGEDWDAEFAARILGENQDYINRAIASLSYD